MLKGRLITWNERLFCPGGNQVAMRVKGAKMPDATASDGCDGWLWPGTLPDSVLIIIPRPDAVKGFDVPECDRVRLVEHDTCDAVADDLGVG